MEVEWREVEWRWSWVSSRRTLGGRDACTGQSAAEGSGAVASEILSHLKP